MEGVDDKTGNERDQLRATLRACIDQDDVRAYVAADESREQFFRDRRSRLTSCTIALQERNVDLRDAAADRIYDIRCKIVHTKDGATGEEIGLLLPNSPEARSLGEDIELVRSISTRVIAASSRELTL